MADLNEIAGNLGVSDFATKHADLIKGAIALDGPDLHRLQLLVCAVRLREHAISAEKRKLAKIAKSGDAAPVSDTESAALKSPVSAKPVAHTNGDSSDKKPATKKPKKAASLVLSTQA